MEEIKPKSKIKLVIPDIELKDISKLKLKLNLNGSKPRRKNLYKKQLNQIRRMLR